MFVESAASLQISPSIVKPCSAVAFLQRLPHVILRPRIWHLLNVGRLAASSSMMP